MVKSASTAREQLSTPYRKLLQMRPNVKAQYKKQKSSIAKALLDYLSSDSFMYGPLLSPPPKRPALSHNNGAREMFPHCNSPASHNEGGSMITSSNTPPTPPSSTLNRMSTFTKRLLRRATENNARKGNEVATLNRMSTLTKRFLRRATENNAKKGNEVAPSASEVLQKYREETPFKDNEKGVDEYEGNGDGNVTDEAGDDDESSKSFTESQTENDVTPLHKEAAMEVARRVVRKVGGRFSKELGIFVDIRDSEAERWFLATTFLSQSSDFELAKHMYKKLQAMGISKIQDVLGIDQSELEEAFQHVMHNKRIASHLQKIALGLHSEHGGGICTLKRNTDCADLKRQLEKLPGYSRSAARIFLREMRGVWPGASPQFEIRTRNAARHLHLLASIKDGAEATSSLVEVAQDAGLDERDLEVALGKLSCQHARQYRSCPGGRECEFARITLSDLDHLIVNL